MLLSGLTLTNVLLPATCLLMGASIFILARTIRNSLYSENLKQGDDWRYDINRINSLREHSLIYQLFYPVIVVLAALNRGLFRESLSAIAREVQAAGLSRFWTPEEYLARLQMISLLLCPGYIYLCLDMMGTVGLVSAGALTLLTGYLLRKMLSGSARYRLFQIKKKMPFLLDLVTLLMEAGSTFLQFYTKNAIGLAAQVDTRHGQPHMDTATWALSRMQRRFWGARSTFQQF